MTKDEIIKTAIEEMSSPFDEDLVCFTHQELTNFVSLIAASEREACARVCEAKYQARTALGRRGNDTKPENKRPVWPDGYLKAEAVYCRWEQQLFDAGDSDFHRALFRPDVLRKREEFRLMWKHLTSLVADAEREACAKLCDKAAKDWDLNAWDDVLDKKYGHKGSACEECAETIRSRSQS